MDKQILTLKKYMTNADIYKTGAVNTSAVQQNYKFRYNELLRLYKKFTVNKASNDDGVFMLVKVPSETLKGILYDVVIKFKKDGDGKIENHEIQVFSNIPAFIYYHAFIYNSYDLLIPELSDKFPEEISEPPEIRNKQYILTYEKSIYYACLYIYSHLDFMYMKDTINVKDLCEKYVASSDAKNIECKKERDRIAKEKRDLKKELKKASSDKIKINKLTGKVSANKKSIKTVNRIKSSKSNTKKSIVNVMGKKKRKR